MMEASVETKISFDEIDNIDLSYVMSKADEISAQFEREFSSGLFRTLEEVTTKPASKGRR